MNSAAVNMSVQISFPEVELLDHDSFIFIILRKLHTVSPSRCTNLHSHQQCIHEVSLFSISSPKLVFSCLFFFFYDSHSDRCEVISPVVLICISLMINDAEHLSCELGI